MTANGERGIWLDIVNTGFVPTTITQAGFDMSDERVFLATEPHQFDQGSFSEILAPQARLRHHFKIGADTCDEFSKVTQSFVTAATGEKFIGPASARPNDVTVYKETISAHLC